MGEGGNTTDGRMKRKEGVHNDKEEVSARIVNEKSIGHKGC